jgi:hypothetical protein
MAQIAKEVTLIRLQAVLPETALHHQVLQEAVEIGVTHVCALGFRPSAIPREW